MPKNDDSVLRLNGEVTEALPNAMFRVRLEAGDRVILARLSGKMKVHYIKVLPGDWVTVELSIYDLERGRIVTRLKPDEVARQQEASRLAAQARVSLSVANETPVNPSTPAS